MDRLPSRADRHYVPPVELRQLEAFVAVARELHFGRAADALHLGQPTLSDTIRRLEREVGAPLFTRTTRRVALTSAGQELLPRAVALLADVAAAVAAVRRLAGGHTGTVRLGVTPPAAPVLVPHLLEVFAAQAPEVAVDVQRLWLPALTAALADGTVDVGITCGHVPTPDGFVSTVFCGEPLEVGLRRTHPRADAASVDLHDLVGEVLGLTDSALFPAWTLSQQQALTVADVDPPTVTLAATDLAARHWADQTEVDWVLLMPSLSALHDTTAVVRVTPTQLVPFTLQWCPDRAETAAVGRFVDVVLGCPLPPGWHTLPGHRGHAPHG
jgi:DNA-binding transcriptional LysR family regulator